MSEILERLELLETKVRRLDRELAEVRDAVAGDAGLQTASPIPPASPVPAATPMPPASTATPPAPGAPAYAPPPVRPSQWVAPPPATAPLSDLLSRLRPRLDTLDLLGARGLALAGGLVTLLGVVFLFVLATNRGWIGPVERIAMGGTAAALLLAAGVVLHARYGQLHAAVAAAGAGIAGGYATLVAASALYELVPPLGALALAGSIAAVGVVLSLRWSSEIVAGLGLIGAMAVPLMVLANGDLSVLGTAFVAVVLAGATSVALKRDWHGLLVAAAAVSAPQILVLVLGEGSPSRLRVVALAGIFVALYLAAGVLRQLAAGERRLDGLAGSLSAGAALLGGVSAFALLDGTARGAVLLLLALLYAALAAALWREETLELAALAAAASTVLAAIGASDLVGGPALVVAWTAEAVALAWLGKRIAESRFQLLAIGYLGLALLRTVSVEAPPDLLYERGADFTGGIPSLVALAAGCLAFGLLARGWPAARGRDSMAASLRELVDDLHARRHVVSTTALATAGVAAIDAASLALLGLFEWLGVDPSFEWGHVAVTALWSLIALVLLATGLTRRLRPLELGGLVTLVAALVSFTGLAAELGDVRGWGALVLAVAFASAAVVHGLLGGRPLAVAVIGVAAGAAHAAGGSAALLPNDLHGYGFLAAATLHALIAFAVWRRRELATCFWVAGLALGLLASGSLLDDTWLVLAWSVTAAALAAVSRTTGEPRLWLGSAAFVMLASLSTLATLAPPDDFLRASASPADGVPALLCLVGALAAAFRALKPVARRDALDGWLDERIVRLREAVLWALGGVALYAASLSILDLVEGLSASGATTDFQRGHTAVSAFWGIVALTALVSGLRRGSRVLRLTGLGLFVLALGKIFVYDLSTLSSVTRALSFLAVGGVLLVAGFLYQRLASAT